MIDREGKGKLARFALRRGSSMGLTALAVANKAFQHLVQLPVVSTTVLIGTTVRLQQHSHVQVEVQQQVRHQLQHITQQLLSQGHTTLQQWTQRQQVNSRNDLRGCQEEFCPKTEWW